jgi:hypothetical protein
MTQGRPLTIHSCNQLIDIYFHVSPISFGWFHKARDCFSCQYYSMFGAHRQTSDNIPRFSDGGAL